ncbi:hypothetical protein C8P68_101229 [Mucilaginibacter yixingensis]|uniref:Uncharacterized protein n=1 Tax=Mucilaginibacter yixingensis TaxID=1295612 RepID=A0A2T5JF04_9SPHI|nr:hypothetical protein [Mucilaginibacter yixingensis]PTR00999.1 hypothetical protein C8P68_101229 [Mucilaginibacter yixingensis]
MAATGCKPDIKETGKAAYFDIAGYFKGQTAVLTKQNPFVNKTAIHNGASQTRKVQIGNWEGEFEQFIKSDINKPAWRQSYVVNQGKGLTVYKANNPGLKTQKIILKQKDGKLVWIYIYNHDKNLLFESYEDLAYYPDSVYTIKKWQHVKLMGVNRYEIRGEVVK